MRRNLIGIVLAALLVACTGGTVDTTTTTELTTTTSTSSTTTSSSTTSTTTTTQPTTTTTEGTLEASTPEQVAALFALSFAGSRDALIEVTEGFDDVESVDKFVLDTPQTGDSEADLLEMAVLLEVTSTWASADNQEDGAWFIVRAISALWDEDEGGWYHDLWVPDFILVNSGTTYDCPGEFMVDLAGQFAGRTDWLESCT